MRYWNLILAATFLLIATPGVRAHNMVTVNGKTQDHQHVYRRQEYGKPLQQGHVLQAGGSSTVIWSLGTQSDYGKSTVRRSGPIIDDEKPRSRSKPKGRYKYGTAVTGYGKPK